MRYHIAITIAVLLWTTGALAEYQPQYETAYHKTFASPTQPTLSAAAAPRQNKDNFESKVGDNFHAILASVKASLADKNPVEGTRQHTQPFALLLFGSTLIGLAAFAKRLLVREIL